MKLERPEIDLGRVVVVARPDNGESKSVTLYGTSPQEVIDKVKALVAAGDKGRPRKPAA